MELVPLNVGRQVRSSSHDVADAQLFSSGEPPFWSFEAGVFPADCQFCLLKVNFTFSPLYNSRFLPFLLDLL